MGDLNEIMIFTRVAQLGSFSAAAKSLRAPVSTISRKISELETRLGLTLIKRTTRKLNLTDEGMDLLERCAVHIQGLEEAEAGLTNSRAQLNGLLRVTAPVALGRGQFIEFISQFLQKHPKIKIDLVVTNQFIDFITGNVDVAIRFGELEDSSLIAKRLGTSRRVLVASPNYLARKGMPRAPQDLKNHDCVLFLNKGEESVWELINGRSRAKVRVTGKVSGNNFETVNELAVYGHGVAFVPEAYATIETESNRLKRVMPHWSSGKIPVHAVYLNRKFVPAKLQVFLNELSTWKNANWTTA